MKNELIGEEKINKLWKDGKNAGIVLLILNIIAVVLIFALSKTMPEFTEGMNINFASSLFIIEELINIMLFVLIIIGCEKHRKFGIISGIILGIIYLCSGVMQLVSYLNNESTQLNTVSLIIGGYLIYYFIKLNKVSKDI